MTDLSAFDILTEFNKEEYNLDANSIILDKNSIAKQKEYLSIIIALYDVVAVIILLNMLIAMMSQSFENVVEKSKHFWVFNRTKLSLAFIKGQFDRPVPMNLIDLFNYRNYVKIYKIIADRIGAVVNNGDFSSCFNVELQKQQHGQEKGNNNQDIKEPWFHYENYQNCAYKSTLIKLVKRYKVKFLAGNEKLLKNDGHVDDYVLDAAGKRDWDF